MEDPEVYHRAEILKSDMQNFFDEYKERIHFRDDEKDSLLDIGCAAGNITIDVIRATLLPKTYSRLVGVDISRKMINYADEHFKLPNVSFEVLDIGGDISDFLMVHHCFDHVTSTLCLHLVPDQERSLKNIFNLLQPNGDCLLYIIVDCFVFDVYRKMDKKWSKYMEDADDYISPYYQRVNPQYLMKKYLKNAGFARYDVQIRNRTLTVDGIKEFRESFPSVIPFLHRMSATEKEEFIDEFVDHSLEMTLKKSVLKNGDIHTNGAGGGKVNFPYTLMTVFAEKN